MTYQACLKNTHNYTKMSWPTDLNEKTTWLSAELYFHFPNLFAWDFLFS